MIMSHLKSRICTFLLLQFWFLFKLFPHDKMHLETRTRTILLDSMVDAMLEQYEAAAKLYHRAITEMRQKGSTNLDSNLITVADDIMRDIKRNIFPFFELPGELRDQIYDESFVDAELVAVEEDSDDNQQQPAIPTGAKRPTNTKVVSKGIASISLQLVSRRFCQEYRARLPRETAVVLSKVSEILALDLKSLTIPRPLRDANHIEIHMTLQCGQVEAWPQQHIDHIRAIPTFLARLEPTQTVTIYWIFVPKHRHHTPWRLWRDPTLWNAIKRLLDKNQVNPSFAVYVCAGAPDNKFNKWTYGSNSIEHLDMAGNY